MSAKAKVSPPRLSMPRKSTKKMSSQTQPRRTSKGQDFTHLASNSNQDCEFSPVDNFSLSPSMYGSCAPQLNNWALNDPGLMSSNSSCASEATEESFETGSISKVHHTIQDPQLFPFPAFSHDLMSSSAGEHSDSFSALTDAQSTTGIGNSPQLAYNDPQGYQNLSPMLDFAFDNASYKPNGARSHTTEDKQPIGFNGHEMQDSEMFTPSTTWEHLSVGDEDFSVSAANQLTSLFTNVPVTPPLTDSGNDVIVTSACTQTGYSHVPGSDSSKLADVSAALSNPAFSIGDPFFPVSPPLSEQDPNRTIRASKHNQRPMLSTAGPEKTDLEIYASPATFSQHQDIRSPRDHPYYSLPTQSDGKYHCPFATGEKPCNHAPTTQKCGYHKSLDSHLKPYRCRVPQCVDAHFSSNACLFRHEREAHGMHGHGDNPHLCHFPTCERSIIGNGFPRRWNLFDHMKRVHDYTSSERVSSPEQSPVVSQQSKKKDNPVRKRKGATNGATTMKRTRSAQSQASGSKAAQSLARQGQQLQKAERSYYDCLSRLQEDLHKMNPEDPALLDRANASLQELHTLGINYRYLRAGQVATEQASGLSG